MGFKETRAYLEKCVSRLALDCPFGFAAGRNKLCVCVYSFILRLQLLELLATPTYYDSPREQKCARIVSLFSGRSKKSEY
jgi:hypothetical protein